MMQPIYRENLKNSRHTIFEYLLCWVLLLVTDAYGQPGQPLIVQSQQQWTMCEICLKLL